jgi:hypothetical protein
MVFISYFLFRFADHFEILRSILFPHICFLLQFDFSSRCVAYSLKINITVRHVVSYAREINILIVVSAFSCCEYTPLALRTYVLKNAVLCVVMPYGSCKNRNFDGTYHLHHQGDKNRRARKNISVNYQLKHPA